MARPKRGRATRSVRKLERQQERQSAEQRRRRVKATVLWGAGGVVAALIVGVVFLGGDGGGAASAPADGAALALAEANAGTPVQVYEGNAHTVYHSTAALPSLEGPSGDPRPTLVWFSGTWCHFCERMEPFANRVAAGFGERVRFVEKSVDHDRSSASRYGVRGTPTFVLIDATGQELARFHYQASPDAFAQTIEQALTAAGA